MTTRRLHAILKRHRIRSKFWPEFRAMVELGLCPSKELLSRMNSVANYHAARSEITNELAKETLRHFPPDDYEYPADYDFGVPAETESFTPEDTVCVASGGCAV
jgi:hypothetical protein